MIKKVEAKLIRFFHVFMYMMVCSTFYVPYFIAKSFFVKVTIEGKDNLPKKGRFILAANHQNFYDGFLVSFLYSPLKIIHPIIARRALKPKFFELLAESIDAVILDDGIEAYQRALKKLNKVLMHGGVVTIFPEGGVSNSSTPKRFKGGVAKLSIDSRSKVVPIHISGTYNLRALKFWFKNPEVKIIIGKPIELYRYADEYNNDLGKLASFLRDNIVALSTTSQTLDFESTKQLSTNPSVNIPVET